MDDKKHHRSDGAAERGKEDPLNWDEIAGSWAQVKGRAREQWGELTDSELDQIGGRKDQLVGLLQQKYGHLRAAAERELDEWAGRLDSVPPDQCHDSADRPGRTA